MQLGSSTASPDEVRSCVEASEVQSRTSAHKQQLCTRASKHSGLRGMKVGFRPPDYTPCFYKYKTSRDEMVLPYKQPRKQQKLSQVSETLLEDFGRDQKPSECASEPLLDGTNNSSIKGGNTSKHSKDSTRRTNSRRRASTSTHGSGEERADENAGQQRQPASRSKQSGADGAQPAPQPTQTSRKKKGT